MPSLAKGNSLLANIHDNNNISLTTNTLKKAEVAILRPSSEQCTIKNTIPSLLASYIAQGKRDNLPAQQHSQEIFNSLHVTVNYEATMRALCKAACVALC